MNERQAARSERERGKMMARKYEHCNCPHGYSYGCPTCPPEDMMIVRDERQKPAEKSLGQVAFETWFVTHHKGGSQIKYPWKLVTEPQTREAWERAAQAVAEISSANLYHECLRLKRELANAEAQGTAEERAKVEAEIVAWLRDQAKSFPGKDEEQLADDIERWAHRKS